MFCSESRAAERGFGWCQCPYRLSDARTSRPRLQERRASVTGEATRMQHRVRAGEDWEENPRKNCADNIGWERGRGEDGKEARARRRAEEQVLAGGGFGLAV